MLTLSTLALMMVAQPESAPEAAPPEADAQQERVICRRETVLNSRIRTRRICLTAREWAERQNLAGQSLKYVTDRSGLGCARTDTNC